MRTGFPPPPSRRILLPEVLFPNRYQDITNISGCYGEAQLLKKERKKKKKAVTNQRFHTAVSLLKHHLLTKCQGIL